jgi:hypothetical protein
MTARQVHSVLAAGLENPALISRWRPDPRLLLTQGAELEDLDLDSLRKFAGLAAKIRHNGIRDKLPLTFRLMSVAKLEIEVFAAYAEDCAQNGVRFAAAVDDKIAGLVVFLGKRLRLDDLHQCLLWDLARHEQALATLSRTPPSPPPDGEINGSGADVARIGAATRVRIGGATILHEMTCDPDAVRDRLYQSTPRLDDLEIGVRLFCYWRPDGDDAIQVLQLDEFGYYLIGAIDGDRSVADLSAALGCGRRPTRAFLHALRQLASSGLLRFAGAPGRGR